MALLPSTTPTISTPNEVYHIHSQCIVVMVPGGLLSKDVVKMKNIQM
jgi:hypothetical protein